MYKQITREPRKDRWQFTAELIMNNNLKRIAEVGVSRGDHAREVLKILIANKYKLEYFLLVDIEERKKYQYAVSLSNSLSKKMFSFNPDQLEQCDYRTAGSYHTSVTVPDESLDFIFQDADASKREYLKQDIELWRPKLSAKGFMCGRYLLDKENDSKPTGYIRGLVNEIFGEENVSLQLLKEQCSGKDDYYWRYQNGTET